MAADKRFRATTLVAYAAPALPLAALQLPVYIFLPTVYAKSLGLGFGAVGTALLIARLIDAVSDPAIGYLSDATTHRFGRRKIWVAAGGPAVMAGAWWLFFPGEAATLAGLLIASVLLYVGWTMVILPLNAWGAELSGDYHERSRIAGFREGFVVAGSLLALGVVWASGWDGGAGRTALNAIGWTVLLLLPLGLGAALYRVPDPPPLRRGAALGWRTGLRAVVGNRPFRRLIAAYLLNGIANGLPATLFVLFVSAGLQRPDAVGWLLFVYFLSGVLAVPLWLRLSYNLGKHRCWCIAMLWACAIFAFVPLLGPGDVLAFAAISVLTGAALGADLVLPAAMQADVVDQDTAQTGQQRTGIYFALWSMVTKLALALAVGLAFPALEAAGFNTGQQGAGGTAQDISAQQRLILAALYALVPIAFKVAATALMWRHPLGEAEVRATRGTIAERWETGSA